MTPFWRSIAVLLTGALSAALAPAAFAQKKVSIEGVDGEVGDNIQAWLSLSEEPCDAPAWRLEAGVDQAILDIRQSMQAFGYYSPRITPTFQATEGERCWQVTFDIEPGPRVKVRNVDVRLEGEADTDEAFRRLIERRKPAPGTPLRHDSYEALKNGISELAAARGYFDSRFTLHELQVDPEAGYADMVLLFVSGARYRFGETRVDQDVIDDSLLRRYLHYSDDEPYARSALTETSRALSSSGYFDQVLVQPLLDAASDRRVPIQISVTRSKRHQYTASIGFATDTGPRLGLGYRNQRLNRRGHQFSSDLSLSEVISKMTLGYTIPMKKPETDKLTLEAGYRHENTDSYRANTTALSATWSHMRSSRWLEERVLAFGREDYKVGSDDKTTSVLLMPGIGWSKTVADNRLYPRKGYRLSFKTRGSLEQVVSDVSFVQLMADAKGIVGLPWRLRLISRVNSGVSFMNKFDQLPASVRFFAGGDNSVRGYAYKSLGPENADGEVEGGKNLLVGSLEIERPIAEKWGVSAFVDSGNAFDDTDIDPKTGVGLGINWRSPVGPIRLDFAHPLDKNGDFIRVHFVMGPDL
jgi:translocation and assembly module TamA